MELKTKYSCHAAILFSIPQKRKIVTLNKIARNLKVTIQTKFKDTLFRIAFTSGVRTTTKRALLLAGS
jgi:hypothetical protein